MSLTVLSMVHKAPCKNSIYLISELLQFTETFILGSMDPPSERCIVYANGLLGAAVQHNVSETEAAPSLCASRPHKQYLHPGLQFHACVGQSL